MLAGLGSWWLLAVAVRHWDALRSAAGGGQSPDVVLGGLAALSAGLLLAWLTLGTILAALGSLPGAVGGLACRGSARFTPALLRSAVAAMVGTALVVGSGATAASADPVVAAAPHSGAPSASATGWPDPGWVPSPPPAPPSTPPGDVGLVSAAGSSARSVDQGMVVRRGDTLWVIAGRHLERGASAAEIAHEWPRWYAANRALIGPDPDRLVPGQILRPPARR